LIETEADRGALVITLPVSGVRVHTAPKPVITEFDLKSVSEARVDLGHCVVFHLAPAAARDLYRLTATNIGRRLVLLVNGEPIGARVIDGPVEAGLLFMFVEVPDANLADLVADLNYTTKLIQKETAR